MKIIGESRDGFVVTCTKEEAARLRGHYSDYGLREAKTPNEVGSCFDVPQMYDRASDIIASYKEIKDRITDVQKRTQRLLGYMAPDEDAK